MDYDREKQGAGNDPDAISDRIGKVVRGDEQALEWLVEWLSPLMIAWARSQLQTPTPPGTTLDPEDVVQDVWVRILPKLTALQSHPETGRWTPAVLGAVKKTLIHRVIDLRRAAARQKLIAPQQHQEQLAQTANSGSAPYARALRSERRRKIQGALDLLGPRERQLYIKRVFEGCTIAELAAEFGMRADAVIKARQRARKKLENILAPQLLDALEPH